MNKYLAKAIIIIIFCIGFPFALPAIIIGTTLVWIFAIASGNGEYAISPIEFLSSLPKYFEEWLKK